MKNRKIAFHGIVILLLISVLFACKKDKVQNTVIPLDYREAVIGEYVGIRINTQWTGSAFSYDTTQISMFLTKSASDSIIDLAFNPVISNLAYSFLYSGGTFTCTNSFHAPSMTLSHDTLFFHVQPGLGPYWDDCITKKKP